MTRSAALIATILVFPGSYASAEPPGRISGRVVDQTGAPLPAVSVDLVVYSEEVTTTSDAAGLYRFENVPAGKAELTYRLLDFSVLRRTSW
jgi:Carboxypeptidase regulatory-like domain